MTNATITEQYLLDVLHKHSEGANFPINFEDVWQSAGYTLKENAVRFLNGCKALKKGKHYIVSSERTQTPKGGRSSHLIRMSIDGYQFFLSKSNTEQGDANLWYLIEVEKQYRKSLERQLKASVRVEESSTALKEIVERLKLSLGQANVDKEILLKTAKDLKRELNQAEYQLKQVGTSDEIAKAQKECYLALRMCRKHVYDYEDIMEAGHGDVEYYANKLIPVLSKKINQTLTLSENVNALMGFYVDVFEELYGTEEHNTHFTQY